MPDVPELQKLAERMPEYDQIAHFLNWLMNIDGNEITEKICRDRLHRKEDIDWMIIRYMGLSYQKIQQERLALAKWEESCNSN